MKLKKRDIHMKRGRKVISEKMIIIFFSLVFMVAFPITFINSIDVQYLFSKILRQVYFLLGLL